MAASNSPVSCVVDSDILIDYLRGRPYARDLLREWRNAGPLALSVITVIEVLRGMRPGEEPRTTDTLASFETLPLDEGLAYLTGQLLRELRARGVTIAVTDGTIGATALREGVPILTNNLRDCQFAGIQVISGRF